MHEIQRFNNPETHYSNFMHLYPSTVKSIFRDNLLSAIVFVLDVAKRFTKLSKVLTTMEAVTVSDKIKLKSHFYS